MTSGDRFQGDLVDVPLADALSRLFLREATGILTVKDKRVIRKICLIQGQIRFVASNLREESLAGILLARGLVTPEVHESLSAAAGKDVRMGRLAVRHLGLSEVAVADVLREQIRTTIRTCLPLLSGTFRFDPGQPDLGDEIETSLSPGDLVLEWARGEAEDPAQVEATLSSTTMTLVAMPGALTQAPRMSLEPMEGYLLTLADGQRTVAELIDCCPVEREAAAQALSVILRSGLVAPPDFAELVQTEMEEALIPAPGAAAGAREAIPPTTPFPGPAATPPVAPDPPPISAWEPPQRDEVQALLQRIELDDLFAVLDLPAGAEIPEVRVAYYNLARRFHPDRFREGPLADLHPGIESAFTRITEAYTTLSEPEARREYQTRGAAAAPQVGPNPQELAAINFHRGRELLEAGRRLDALGFLENAVRLNPEIAVYHQVLGLLQAQNPRLRQEAEESLRQALERDPSDPVARVGLGLVLHRAGKEEEATRELEETLRWHPDHPAALAALGKGPVTQDLRSGPLGPLLPD